MVDSNDYKCLFIDFDNTLVNYITAEEKALTMMAKENNIEEIDEFLLKYSVKNKKLWNDFEKGTITIPEIKFQRFEYLQSIFPKLDGHPNELNETYLEKFIEFTTIKKEDLRIVKKLSKKYTLIIVSNGIHDIQTQRITNTGLMNVVHNYCTSQEAGGAKPAPMIFDLALQKAKKIDRNIKKDNILMIGDSYNADIIGAQEWGCAALWINPNPEGEFQPQLKEFGEILEYLEKPIM